MPTTIVKGQFVVWDIEKQSKPHKQINPDPIKTAKNAEKVFTKLIKPTDNSKWTKKEVQLFQELFNE